MRAGRDAYGPRRSNTRDLRLRRAFGVEDLDALITAVGDVQVVAGIEGDRERQVELTGIGPARPPRLDVLAVRIVLGDAGVAEAVRHVDVARAVPRDVGGAIEVVARDARARVRARLERQFDG